MDIIATLRSWQTADSPEITDEEFEELSKIVPVEKFTDWEEYEYSGNFILSKDIVEVEEARMSMCCGIMMFSYELSTGDTVHLAFDYGH
jgi:hypothetical protein